MVLFDILKRQKDNKKIALIYQDKQVTYEEMYNQVLHNLEILNKQSFTINNTVGIFLPNSLEYVAAYFTITGFERIIVPIPYNSKAMEIEGTIDYCELNLIITNQEGYKKLQSEIPADLKYINIFLLDTNEVITRDTVKYQNYSLCNFTEEKAAILLHTSGTTSDPKRVMLSHKNIVTNIKSNIASLGLNDRDRSLIILPMFFGYCNTAQFLSHFFVGASIVIYDGLFVPVRVYNIVDKNKITNFTAVPTMLLMLLNDKRKNVSSMDSVRFICFGGGPITKEKLQALIEKYGKTSFIHTYGQTEASPRVTALMPEYAIKKIGSVGKPIPGVEVKIISDNGEVSPHEIGEVRVRGENVMLGYYKREDITAKTIQEGWLHTGDLAYFDHEGFIYLVGRKKNMIISGGLNIYPEEIEGVLKLHTHVKDAIVYGESDEYLGEEIYAKVTLHENIVTEADLIHFCSDKISSLKIPKRIIIVDSLEKTKTGKIRRKNHLN